MKNAKILALVITATLLTSMCSVQMPLAFAEGPTKYEKILEVVSGSQSDLRTFTYGGHIVAEGFAVDISMMAPIEPNVESLSRAAFAVSLASSWGEGKYTYKPRVSSMWVKFEGDSNFLIECGGIVDNTGTGGECKSSWELLLDILLFILPYVLEALFETPPREEWQGGPPGDPHWAKAIVRSKTPYEGGHIQPKYNPSIRTAGCYFDSKFLQEGYQTLTITAGADICLVKSWWRGDYLVWSTISIGTYSVSFQVRAPVTNAPYPPSKPSGPTFGYLGTAYSYSTSTTDPNGDNVRYVFDWGDGSNTTTGWYASGYTATASHSWDSPGTYYVSVRAQDSYYEYSDWSSYLAVSVGVAPGAPATPSKPSGPTFGYVGYTYTYSASTTDPNGDSVRYQFDWGDGTRTWTGWYASGATASASHSWSDYGTYYVKVRAKDTYNKYSAWSESLGVSIYLPGGGSCPFIYSWDGQRYRFDHEAYPFAVMKSVETTSFDRLKYLKEVDGEYWLKIEQVLHEIDWTDSFELYAVDHPDEDSFVMPDLQGNLHTVKELIQPISAYEKNGDDCLEDVKYLDDKIWKDSIFDADVNDESTLRNWIVLTFPKPEGVTEAKLMLSVKKQITITQEWEFFINLIGENYWDLWQNIMENPTLTRLFMDMLEREVQLRIEVWNGTEWVLQDTISAGDALWDDFLAVLDISDVEGDELQIRLKSTTAHYEINYVGIDYSEDEPMIVHKVDPYYAVKNGEEDVLAALEKPDENYVTLLPNDVIELRYEAIPESGWKRDFTIATKGYYNFVGFQNQTFSGFLEGATLWLKALIEPYFVPKTVFPYLQEA